MSKNVSDQIVEMLTDVGVKQIFGIPGDTIDSLMESLRVQKAIDFIIMRHEEVGAFAATGQAKLTGDLGVCVACQGPGAVHLLNGLYDAAMDQVPVLAITGQVDSALIGTQATQEINQISLFDDVAVYNQEVRSAENLPEVLTLAIQTAIAKKGVSHISIPSDVMREKAIKWTKQNSVFHSHSTICPSEDHLKIIADMINKADKVAVLYGGGARLAGHELLQLSDQLNAPLVHTTRSKDIINNQHPHYVGGIGLMGSMSGNHAVTHCDLLLIVGSSFAFKDFYPKNAPIVQIDIDPTRLGLRVPVTYSVAGDARISLQRLLKLVKKKANSDFMKEAQAVHEKSLKRWEKQAKKTPDNKPLHPQTVMKAINEHADKDAIFCFDSGTVTIWGNNYLRLNGNQRFLWSWNLATLGCSLPYAIGCQLAEPGRQVVALAGDGGFEMLISDFATAVKYELPIIFIVYNNSKYGFIELEEAGEGNPAFGTKFTNPDFAKLAEAYGALGLSVSSYLQLDDVLKQAFSANRTVIVDVFINPDELVMPPQITAKMVKNFTKAKVRSYFA